MGTSSQKTIEVGILRAASIQFELNGSFGGYSGPGEVSLRDGKLLFEGGLYDRLLFEPSADECNFLLKDVVIGIGFHWERKENQRFEGSLAFVPEDNQVRAVNILSVEQYLVSVIASEMSATCQSEYLKAHAVISRSWLLSQMGRYTSAPHPEADDCGTLTPDQWIKWWDREDHVLFDVCADDHCQRYQGITRPSLSYENVRGAVDATRGEVLESDGKICDTRFSKCCGGYMERFSTAWGNTDYPYLQGVYDGEALPDFLPAPDLTDSVQAEIWIKSNPPAFCNTQDKEILGQVLNTYDRETTQFYRWEVKYTAAELSEIVKERLGVDFGLIESIEPLERGASGRICKLRLKGSLRTMVLGKELLIRKAFSRSHLYSSAFVVDKTSKGFVFTGAGWGHGVGFCQIGGAVMASKGYTYDQMLAHYYPSAKLVKMYE